MTGTDEAREAADAVWFDPRRNHDARAMFIQGYEAGVREGIRQAREAVQQAEGVTYHKWYPEGEPYASVVMHSEEDAKSIVLAAIDALEADHA